jgi:hypothetical protein
VKALVFAPDAGALYAVHGYVGVHAWNLADRTGSGLEIDGLRVFGEFAIHAKGRWAFGRRPCDEFGDTNDAFLLDLPNGPAVPFNFSGVVGQHIALSPDGTRVVTVGHSDYDTERKVQVRSDRLYGWQVTATGPRYAWHRDTPADAQPWRIVFAGNTTLVSEDWVPDGPNVLGTPPTRPILCVRSADTGKPLREIAPDTDHIEQLLTSPDGKQLVVRRGLRMWVYDPADWDAPPAAVPGTEKAIEGRAAAFHPTAPYLFLANNGPSVLVYDTTTWKQVRKWKWGAGTLRVVAVSADGALAAAAGPRGTVVVWDLDL